MATTTARSSRPYPGLVSVDATDYRPSMTPQHWFLYRLYPKGRVWWTGIVTNSLDRTMMEAKWRGMDRPEEFRQLVSQEHPYHIGAVNA